MSNKSILKVAVAFGILAILLIFLGVNFVPRIFASSPAKQNLVQSVKVIRPNYVDERYQRAVLPRLSFAGSDWFERHPTGLSLQADTSGSDWIERHQSSYYTGSDYGERHP